MSYEIEIFDWVSTHVKEEIPEYSTLQELKILKLECLAELRSLDGTIEVNQSQQEIAVKTGNECEVLDLMESAKRLKSARKKRRTILSVLEYNIEKIEAFEKEERRLKHQDTLEKAKLKKAEREELAQQTPAELQERIAKLEALVKHQGIKLGEQKTLLENQKQRLEALKAHLALETESRRKFTNFVERTLYFVIGNLPGCAGLSPSMDILKGISIVLARKPDWGLAYWRESGFSSSKENSSNEN